MSKKIEQLSERELNDLLDRIGDATSKFLAPGTKFLTLLFADDGTAQIVSNMPETDVRSLLDGMARGNGKTSQALARQISRQITLPDDEG